MASLNHNKPDSLPSSFLSTNVEFICPETVYKENPEYGLRDIALKVITALKQNKQVLVIDELQFRSTRRSLLETIKKKVSSCRVQLVQVIPMYGFLQVMWSLQFSHAGGVLPANLKDEEHLRRWFDDSMQNIDYASDFVANQYQYPFLKKWTGSNKKINGSKSICNLTYNFSTGKKPVKIEMLIATATTVDFQFISKLDKPSEEEGYVMEVLSVPLQAKSHFKLEFPAMFFQWEGVLSENEELNPKVEMLCNQWAAQNPCGRILFIHDKRNVNKDIPSSTDESNNFMRCLTQLSVKIKHPVYLIQIRMSLCSGSFCVPPQPGILAFLQLHHLLNLHSRTQKVTSWWSYNLKRLLRCPPMRWRDDLIKILGPTRHFKTKDTFDTKDDKLELQFYLFRAHYNTCYIFNDVMHMKMAEAAGVRHLKISAIKSPDVVLKGHGLTPCVPAMLRTMVVEKSNPTTVPQIPTVPLFDCRHEIKDGHVSYKFENGLEEHVFVKDIQSFCRYQEEFTSHVTPIDHTGSKLISMCPAELNDTLSAKNSSSSSARSLGQDASEVDIPQWMRKKRSRQESRDERCIINQQRSAPRYNYGSSKTVYVMSEKEAVEMARQLLLEASHEDIDTAADQKAKEHVPS